MSKDSSNHILSFKFSPNEVCRTSNKDVPDGVIEYIVSQVGADKVLFGTDQPMRDAAPQLGWVTYSRLPEEEKAKIVGINMRKILRSTRLPM